ncbi:hypothetical protein [Sphingomonas sp.]|uniref:hypothetical protein n=1 Tax=Sphingomonas sp. TaxID=28214 RepID=UPI003AFF6A3E
MTAAPRLDSYEWAGGREAMLRFGPDDGPIVVMALPLFEEANRTRAFGVSILRVLATRGIGGVLPDLPGQGESEVATADVRLVDLTAAFAAVPGTRSVAIRSGALFVDARPCWVLSPQSGAALARELARMKGDFADGDREEVAGNVIDRELLAALSNATHPGGGRGGTRTVRLASDPGVADRHIPGQPLWRRAEPGNDFALAEVLAADIAGWIASCEG